MERNRTWLGWPVGPSVEDLPRQCSDPESPELAPPPPSTDRPVLRLTERNRAEMK